MPSLSLEEARKRARILVIDDDKDAFPIKAMEDEGYTVHYWPSVKTYGELERGEYDIIVLDIHGIDPSRPGNSGMAVLEHIKRYNPAQIVIAYSGRKYDIKQGAFFKLADDLLSKPSNLIECKQKVDDLLQARFSPNYYWGALKNELKAREISDKSIRNLERELTKAIQNNKKLDDVDIMSVLKTSKEVVGIVSTIIGIIIKLTTS